MQALVQSQGSMVLLVQGQMNARLAKLHLSALKGIVAATTRTAISNGQVGSAGGAPGCWLLAVGCWQLAAESPRAARTWQVCGLGGAGIARGLAFAWACVGDPDRRMFGQVHPCIPHARDTCRKSAPRCEVGCT